MINHDCGQLVTVRQNLPYVSQWRWARRRQSPIAVCLALHFRLYSYLRKRAWTIY
jgi:hypothetical protein